MNELCAPLLYVLAQEDDPLFKGACFWRGRRGREGKRERRGQHIRFPPSDCPDFAPMCGAQATRRRTRFSASSCSWPRCKTCLSPSWTAWTRCESSSCAQRLAGTCGDPCRITHSPTRVQGVYASLRRLDDLLEECDPTLRQHLVRWSHGSQCLACIARPHAHARFPPTLCRHRSAFASSSTPSGG